MSFHFSQSSSLRPCDGGVGDRKLTGSSIRSRGQLRELSQRLAHGFRRTLNPGDVILLFSPNSFYYHSIVLAAQCAGIVFSGANAAYIPSEAAHQIADSGAKLLLVHPSVLPVALAATEQLGWSKERQVQNIVIAVRKDEAGAADERFLTLDSLISDQLLEPHRILKPKETVAYLGYSSGTSGKAKGVRTSAWNMTVRRFSNFRLPLPVLSTESTAFWTSLVSIEYVGTSG